MERFKKELDAVVRVLFFDLYLFSLLFLATRAAALIHELFGHAFWAWAGGGRVLEVWLSRFGGGRVAGGPSGGGLWILVLFSLSGIGMNLASGIFFTPFLKISGRGWGGTTAHLWAALFSLVSLLGAWAYLVLGIYHETGDPVGWTRQVPAWYGALWFPCLFLCPVFSFTALKNVSVPLLSLFPSRNAVGRLFWILATLGVAAGLYAACFFASRDSLQSLAASELAFQRDRARLTAMKRLKLFTDLEKAHPDWTKERIESEVQKAGVLVKPEEVPRRFPLVPVVAGLYLLGGTLGVLSLGKARAGPFGMPGRAAMLGALALAGLVFLWITLVGGVVYSK